jgi:flavin-dependent dehydrogenase
MSLPRIAHPYGVAIDFGLVKLKSVPPPIGDLKDAYAPRRTVLDKILVDAATTAGAELRENFAVEDLILQGDAVVGIRGNSKNGTSIMEKARIVIGADGKDSCVARSVQSPKYNVSPPSCAVYYSYWSGTGLENCRIFMREGAAVIGFSTNDGLTVLVGCWTSEKFPDYRRDIEGTFRKCLQLSSEFADMTSGAKRESRISGLVEMPSFFRKPYGNGWALVGDAGYYKNPLTAQGITDGFRDAELLASAIDNGLSGRLDLNAALADYEKNRNEAVMPIYQNTCDRAMLKAPQADVAQLLMALEGNQEAMNQFVGLDAGTVSFADFFAPENVQRIMESANKRAAVQA